MAKRLSKDNKEEEKSVKIAALFGESVFHSSGCTDDEGLRKECIYVEFGYIEPEKISFKLEKRMKEGREANMTNRRENNLRNIIKKMVLFSN